jgi:hypothetical protein
MQKQAFSLRIICILLLLGEQYGKAQDIAAATFRKNRDLSDYITIHGKSNINKFTFSYSQELLRGNFQPRNTDSDYFVLNIPIRDFHTANPWMYHDFLTLMKESAYPDLQIDLSKNQISRLMHNRKSTAPDVRITIAGISHIYKIPCSVISGTEWLYLQGKRTLRLSDFHIIPPSKLDGLVQVQDEIVVNFGFLLTFMSSNPLSLRP